MIFQKVGQRKVDRKDHCWRQWDGGYKCVLCGAVTKYPPPYPTPPKWMPDRYEVVTKEDDELCPRDK